MADSIWLESGMTLAEQARTRVALAAELARKPIRWIVTEQALVRLRGEAEQDVWGADGAATFLGLPFELGRPRSNWGLELVCSD